MKISVAYIYDTYPQDYQTYIDLIMKNMDDQPMIDSSIYAFNARETNVISLKYGFLKRATHKVYNSVTRNTVPLYLSELSKSNNDIIHIQHSYLFGRFLDAFNNFPERKKFIITLRGADTYLKPWLSENWRSFYEKYGNRIFFVTMSQHQKKYLTQWGVPEHRVFVIPISHNNKQKIDVSHKWDDGKLLKIVSVFRMTWEKNIQGNLLFIRRLIDKGINVQYDVYGDGNDLGELYYLVHRLNLNKHVNIMGKVSYHVLMQELQEYHFILQLSVSEALPSSILEGQSLSIPAIISDSDGLPEAVIPNQSAICGQFWDIDKLVDDTLDVWINKDKYISFCEKSHEHSKNFTVEREASRLIDMYQQILK